MLVTTGVRNMVNGLAEMWYCSVLRQILKCRQCCSLCRCHDVGLEDTRLKFQLCPLMHFHCPSLCFFSPPWPVHR